LQVEREGRVSHRIDDRALLRTIAVLGAYKSLVSNAEGSSRRGGAAESG
jgi:hypothetical protein